MRKILIVDDDASFRTGLAETVGDLGFDVMEAASGDEALEKFRLKPALAFLDLRMRGLGGMELLRALKSAETTARVPVVILTAYADSANTIEAMKLGAFDHLTKPIGRDDVQAVLSRALQEPAVGEEKGAIFRAGEELVGASPGMREVQKLIGLAAAGEATVLVQGETGTGKELVAAAIHRHSARAARPFVAVNCAAIPADLLESELFGHVRGAFTGAVQSRPGRFREADGGTLFLDEIGDMTLPMQAKILRVLQDRLVTPVGGQASVRVDVRIVTATHRDLIAQVQEGRFRQDLFYRVNVLAITLPPLRERGSDILALAEFFLQRAGADKRLSIAAAHALLEHSWPGNVRELQNLMQSVSLTARGEVIDAKDLKLETAKPAADSLEDLLRSDYHTAMERLEKMLLERALQSAQGNRAEAARRLGIHRQLLYSKLKQHGLEPPNS